MTESELIAVQLKHTIDLLKGDLERISSEQKHQAELFVHRIVELEEDAKDHEERIRKLSEGATTFQARSGWANGGTGLLSIWALIRTIQL